MEHTNHEKAGRLEVLAGHWIKLASSRWALRAVLAFVAMWLAAGPFMRFSADWQLIMGTTSAAVTFIMVFLLVRAQAKDTLAMQMKLNEVIGALRGANNQLISIENLSEVAIHELNKRYETVATKLMDDEAVSTESIVPHEMVAKKEHNDKD